MRFNLLKRIVAVTLTAVIALTASACGKSEEQAEPISARVSTEGNKFVVNGNELWINGVNTPWQYWNDFGGSMNEQFWDDTFAQLAEDGINCTRIWINCTGESIVRLKSTGEVQSVNEYHWTDLDKLFELAEKHKIYVMATLLSFDHFKGDDRSGERWRAMITSKEMSDSFAETYVAEFCERYGDCEYLFAIDIMNEPDWVYEEQECGNIPWDNLSYFFGKCASVIHEKCDTLVTVGMGIVKYNSDKYDGDMISDAYLQELTGDEKAYVDFYSTHFYMWQRQWYGLPFKTTPEGFGLVTDKPCLIGETSNDDEKATGVTLAEKYQAFYENGWNGVMVWMTLDESNEWYCYDLTKTATNAMAELIPEKIYPNGKS